MNIELILCKKLFSVFSKEHQNTVSGCTTRALTNDEIVRSKVCYTFTGSYAIIAAAYSSLRI